jgi:AcrR family transcriptional regulator
MPETQTIQNCMEPMSDTRLSADDWIKAGLKALIERGFVALKAEALAKSLGVSRGSFYWHFTDVDAFHAAVLRRWRDIAYTNVVNQIEAGPADQFHALLERAFDADTTLERSIRAWATSAPSVKAVVEAVDAKRLHYLRRTLIDAGLSADTARTRAQIVYWAYLGHVFSDKALNAAARREIVRELTSLAKPSSSSALLSK